MTYEEQHLQLYSEFLRLRSNKELIEKQLIEGEGEEERLQFKLETAEKSKAIIEEEGQKTLDNLSFHISSIVTSALIAVFPDAPEFEAQFVKARKQLECKLELIKDGYRMDPIDSSGGGVCDVVSFALRLTYWTLKKSRPTFFFDEPFKFVSSDLQEKCAQMIEMLSDKLGVQMIIITHLPNLHVQTAKEYNVELIGGRSVVKEVK